MKCADICPAGAIESNGYASWKILDKILKYTDLVLFDIKHLNSAMHRKGTGLGNQLILENLKRILKAEQTRVWLRIPIIPDYNQKLRQKCLLRRFPS